MHGMHPPPSNWWGWGAGGGGVKMLEKYFLLGDGEGAWICKGKFKIA